MFFLAVFFLWLLDRIISVFDFFTGISELSKGKIITFIQITRSRNLLVVPLFLTTGRTIKDCILLSGLSFISQIQLNGGIVGDTDVILAVLLFGELFFFDKKNIFENYNIILKLLTVLARFWILYEKASVEFARGQAATITGRGRNTTF